AGDAGPQDYVLPAPSEQSFMGSAMHLGRSPHRGPETTPSARFKIQTSGRIAASPVLGPDGTIYIGSLDRSFLAVAPDGKLRFRHRASGKIYGAAAVADNGNVYFGADDGFVTALNPLGQILWRKRVKGSIDAG